MHPPLPHPDEPYDDEPQLDPLHDDPQLDPLHPPVCSGIAAAIDVVVTAAPHPLDPHGEHPLEPHPLVSVAIAAAVLEVVVAVAYAIGMFHVIVHELKQLASAVSTTVCVAVAV